MSVEEKIIEIEDEIRRTPLHKASEHHIGTLRGKLAKLREDLVKKSTKQKGSGYSLKKEGDATVILVGFPSVGKSTIINQLTNADSQVGAYDFTTLNAVPGMLDYNDAKIQIVDLPGIIDDASKGKGRGREVLSAARNANLIILVLEVGKEKKLEIIRKELHGVGIRLDKKKPNVIIKKRIIGGIKIECPKSLSKNKLKSVLKGLGVVNAEIVIPNKISEGELIDSVLGNRHYCPSIIVINKSEDFVVKNFLGISGKTGKGLNDLKELIWDKLGLIRIYTKKPGKPVDDEPLIIKKPVTPALVLKSLRIVASYSKVWGESVKHDGQRVNKNHLLKDKDIISFH
ncbi:MAG: GTP-binding protein [Nanoarchaeota archaeon]|nr:GTP-binding protein [Nanoarchaeota archaeon]